MIKHFRIQNFKILQDIQIHPSSVNVLIGPNGCGKSSLLQAIDFLRAFFMSSIEVYLREKDWNYKDLTNVRTSSRTIQWQLTVDLDGDKNGKYAGQYVYSVSLSPRRYLAIGKEYLAYTPPDGGTQRLLRRIGRRVVIYDTSKKELFGFEVPNLLASAIPAFSHPQFGTSFGESRHFATWVRRLAYFLSWDPKILRRPDRGIHSLPGPSGEHLAPVLANLKKRKPREFQALIRRLKRVIPELSDISFSGRGWVWREIRVHEKRGNNDVVLNSRQLSDGLLRLLATTSLLYLDNIPSVVMLEEPENGVHPHILREMVHALNDLTLRKPPNRTQVFFTTHNPYVLDEFYDSPDQIWVMDIGRPHMKSKIQRLSDKSQLAKARESFGSLGEAWFANVFGGSPLTFNFEK